MKCIGFNAGQYGDLAMCVPLCRAVRELWSHSEITLAVGRPYADCSPLFLENPLIDKIHVWSCYEDWPLPSDSEFIDKSKFDVVFEAMPPVVTKGWFNKHYQIEEMCKMHNLPTPSSFKIGLTKFFSDYTAFEGLIAIAPFTNSPSSPKSISTTKWNNIVSRLHSLGHKTLQVSSSSQPDIGATLRFTGTYMESMRAILSCKMLVSIDTGFIWFSSGYNFPTLGLYGIDYYPEANDSKNWQAFNPNSLYLEARKAEDINIDTVISSVQQILT